MLELPKMWGFVVGIVLWLISNGVIGELERGTLSSGCTKVCENKGTLSYITCTCSCLENNYGERCEFFTRPARTRRLCGGKIYHGSGTISPPVADEISYNEHLDCVWQIHGDTVQLVLQSTRFVFEPGCPNGRIEIYGYSADKVEYMLYQYCGWLQKPVKVFHAFHNALHLHYKAARTVTEWEFLFMYAIIDSGPGRCDREIKSGSGVISPPFSVVDIQSGAFNCTWTLRGGQIQLTVFYTHMLYDPDCSGGRLQIFDGIIDRRNMTYDDCSWKDETKAFTSTSKAMFVLFVADKSVEIEAFRIHYIINDADLADGESSPGLQEGTGSPDLGYNMCGPVQTNDTGVIESGDEYLNGRHDGNVKCTWVIKPKTQYKMIMLEITHLSTESSNDCEKDHVKVYDINNVYGVFCGSKVPEVIQSVGTELFIDFKSDTNTNESGFMANYSIIANAWRCYEYRRHEINTINAGTPEKDVCEQEEFNHREFTGRNNTNHPGCGDCPCCLKGGVAHLCGGYHPAMTTGSVINFRVLTSSNNSDVFLNGTNVDCLWTLKANDDYRVWVTMIYEYLSQTENCSQGMIQIFDGFLDFDDQIVYSSCSWRTKSEFSPLWPVIPSPWHNVVYIRLTAQTSRPDKAFSYHFYAAVNRLQQYGDVTPYSRSTATTTVTSMQPTHRSPECGGKETKARGTITPPVHNDIFDVSIECLWTISRGVIELTFNFTRFEFESSCSHGKIEVFDGYWSMDTRVWIYCSVNTGKYFYSRYNKMIVWFTAAHTLTEVGFLMTYTIRDDPCEKGLVVNGDIEGTIGDFDRDRDGVYDDNLNCIWIITSSNGLSVRIKIEKLDIPLCEETASCGTDYIQVFDGSLEGNPILTACGTDSPSTLISTSDKLYVKFFSGINTEKARGFDVTYSPFDRRRNYCKETLYSSGHISHDIILNCTWDIRTSNGSHSKVIFNFKPYQNGENEACGKEYLQVSDGEGQMKPTRYCYSYPPSGNVVTSSGSLQMQFVSENAITAWGFNASYDVYQNEDIIDNDTASCKVTLTQPTDWFGIWYQPLTKENIRHYSNDMNCTWSVTSTEGMQIELSFIFFDIEADDTNACSFDFLQISDENGTLKPYRYCNTHPPPSRISVVSTVLRIWFVSDHSVTAEGFNATYTTIQMNEDQNDDFPQCGGTLNDSEGTFSVPFYKYEDRYDENIKCRWTIRATENNFIEIYDGISNDSQPIGTYCGNMYVPVKRSHGSVLVVDFVSDAIITWRGFTAVYAETRGITFNCGTALTGSVGHFHLHDNDNPGLYDHNLDCKWTITPENGADIHLLIVDLDIDPDTECRYDFLKISEVSGNVSNIVGHYCGYSKRVKIISTSMLEVHFHSDATIKKSGFNASFAIVGVEYRRRWPAGNYSIPMSIYGCPDPDVNTWEYGYINITFQHPVMVDTSPYIMAPFGIDVYQMTFCTMLDRADDLQTITGEWPVGVYKIFAGQSGCPEGTTGSADAPENVDWNSYTEKIFGTYPPVLNGFLPKLDIEHHLHTGGSSVGDTTIRYKFCDVTKATYKFDGGSRFPFIVIKPDALHNIEGFCGSDPVKLQHTENNLFEAEPKNAAMEGEIYRASLRSTETGTTKLLPVDISVPKDYQLDVEVSFIRQSSACHTKCDGDNILHVATLRQATQLSLFIVDLQQ